MSAWRIHKENTEHLAVKQMTEMLSPKLYLAAEFISTGCSPGGVLPRARKSRKM